MLFLFGCILCNGCGRSATQRVAPRAPAGDRSDDGVLARLSASPSGDDPGEAGAGRRARASADGGSAGDGESPYADYRFDRTPRPHSAPLPYGRSYIPIAPAEFGSIEGVVLWPHPPRAPERLPVEPSTAPHGGGACMAGFPNQTLLLGTGGGVANAVVYLEDVSTGRALLGRMNAAPSSTKQLQVGGVLEWRGCRFHPHVQITAPIGSVLSLSSADEAVTVTATRVEGRSRETMWSVLLGAPGVGLEHFLERDGFLELAVERAGRPDELLPANGWIVVAQHPYFAVTDEKGDFVLDEIPPGVYTLVVWHEPVVVGHSRTGEPTVHTPPLFRRKVVVTARQAQRVIIRLPPAGV